VLPVLCLALAASVWTLASGALQPAAPAPYAKLTAWLESQHLSYGLGGYWQSSVITVESGGKVTIRALTDAKAHLRDGTTTSCDIEEYQWETKKTWYDHPNSASFVLMDEDPSPSVTDPLGAFNLPAVPLHALGDYKHYRSSYFGTPAMPHMYTIRKYRYNVLTKIPVVLPQKACLNS
jgi:hypothetical protein